MAEENVSNVFKNFGKDTLLYVPYRIFPVLFGFIGLWVYTRVFSVNDYGVYSLLNITIGLLGILAYSWINEANLRFYLPYKQEERMKTYFTSFFILQGLAVIIITLALLALWYVQLLPGDLAYYLWMLVAAMVVLSFFETVITFLQPERKVVAGSIYRTLSASLYLITSLVFIFFFNLGIASILLGYIVTNLALTILIVVRHHYLSYFDLGSFSLDSMKEFTTYGLPLMGQQLFYWVLVVSDRYIINFFRGSEEVGIYSATYQLAGYPVSLFTSMMLIAALPIIFGVWEKKGEAATKKTITGLMRYYLLFVIPAFAGVTLLSQNIMVILTDAYFSGYVIVPFVCLSYALFGVVWYLNIGMRLKKKTLIQAVLITVAGILDIGLNIVLVPWLGFVGASISLGISYIVYTLLTYVVSRRYLKWPMPWSSIKNILIATAAMGFAVYGTQQYLSLSLVSLVLLVGIGAVVYLGFILLTGEAREESGFLLRAVTPVARRALLRIYRKLPYSVTAVINSAISHR